MAALGMNFDPQAVPPRGVFASVVEAALEYHARGYAPVPIPPREKGPKLKGWQTLKATPERIRQLFRPNSNIGCNLGKISAGLVDVDLDCKEAIEFAVAIVPATDSVFGRASARGAHRLFRVAGYCETLKFVDPILADAHRRASEEEKAKLPKSMIVELRADGGVQTVFPPSIHPEGEAIEWEEYGEPEAVDGDELAAAVTRLAARVLVARYGDQPHEETPEGWLAALATAPERAREKAREWLGVGAAAEPQDAPAESPATFQRAPSQNTPAAAADDFFTAVKRMALQNLSAWVRDLFSSAQLQSGTGAWRVSSKALGRDLEEDLSIAPNGIVDFGVHDMGDPREGKRTAIDLVIEWGGAPDALAAAKWLCERMGVDPESLGALPDRVEWDGQLRNPQPKAKADALATIVVDGETFDAETGEQIEAEGVAEDELDDAQPEAEASPGEDWAAPILARQGLVPDIARWILSASRRPQPKFAVAAALAVVGAVASRHLQAPTEMNVNAYILLVAPSGAGKDAPLKCAARLLMDAGLSGMLGPDSFGSERYLYDVLENSPQCLAVMDEFGSTLAASTARHAPPHLTKVLAGLRKTYSGGPMSTPGAATRGHVTLENPCLTILAASTPDQFFGAVGAEQTEDGLLNRFILAQSGDADRAEPTSSMNNPPAELLDAIKAVANRPGGMQFERFRTRMQTPSQCEKPQLIAWTADAKAAWEAIEEDAQTRRRSDTAARLFANRLAENCQRVAAILAVGENVADPLVTAGHVALARAFVEASFAAMSRGYFGHSAATPESQRLDRIIDRIRRNGGSMKHTALLKDRRNDFARNSKDFKAAMELLIETGDVVEEKAKRTTGGRETTVYRLRKP